MSDYVAGLRSKVGHDLVLLPGVTGVVLRGAPASREVLAVRRSENGVWTLISGAIEPGEQAHEAMVREIHEETTLQAKVTRLLWVQTLPKSTYPNGDQIQYYDIGFVCEAVAGEAKVGDDESSEVAWFPVDALPALDDRYRKTLVLALEASRDVYLGTEGLRPEELS
ncbi:hypothetical protein HX89_14380 (plasmid) [Dermacoccus nishinomiyaensis]|uniref:Nudix hydrolase domain-containing protein n=1 Tax=Dermacoccus nishinomiyaensis TaxID=1274 RepID=A0A075JKM3_9MICO|nr:NUDIX domain-containing protein [Dermacoccus nishinomiyaensis]AIF41892.1 hypothetical protein HX89_14380 [Dermacoccus nishinomiyaensis]